MPQLPLFLFILILTTPLLSCSAPSPRNSSHNTQRPYIIKNKVYHPIPSAYGFSQKGIASWYGKHFHGRTTSNGETYNMYAMTAAHKTLPMNTILLVKNLENNREIVVRVNDRGPFVKGRIIDLTYTGAKKIGMIGKGTARVKITALGDAKKNDEQLQKMAKTFYTGTFYVQIASFKNLAAAKRLQGRFIKAGHQTFIQQYKTPDAVYHRVRVFVGQTLKGAHQARRILEQKGYKNAFVIAK